MAKSNYRFKTIMVSDWARSEFTALRDEISKEAGLRITDKQLFNAIFDEVKLDEVRATLKRRAANTIAKRETVKLQKLQAKVNAKLEALKAPAEPEAIETAESDEAPAEVAA